MKAIVVYGSNFGNTQQVAETVAAEMGAVAVSARNVDVDVLRGVELLVVGTPINGWQPIEAVKDFLDALQPGELKGIEATAFDTRVKSFIHGDAKDKVAAALRRAGAHIIVDTEAFYVAGPQQAPRLIDGELEKAAAWARKVREAMEK